MLCAGLIAAVFLTAEPPAKVVDSRLALSVFAESPQIMTPTGLAIDDAGRVIAIECHTHFRPDDYDGPKADRIRAYEDTDGDGKADKVTTLFEGTATTMALALEPDGAMIVATRNEVFRIKKQAGGTYGDKTTLARLETKGDYPHNGLAGVTLDFAGNVYFGLGENLGVDYRLVGADGKALKGGGEGGNIYRMKPDGSGLERIATGFWNPFALAFDPFGRLFAVDNDPDSRPPCRLLHIVEGGDYGYRFRNGRRGLHPFTAWNGELPGTLPMVAGTGEAPSGIVVYESDGLPADYVGTILGTSWGDHRIERFRLKPKGASFTASVDAVVTGGEDFRPVAIATAPNGDVYVTDWVDKSYSLHKKGRIWRLRGAGTVPARRAEGLASIDRRTRERVARRLAARGQEGVDELARIATATCFTAPADSREPAMAVEALAAVDAANPVLRQVVERGLFPDVRALAAGRVAPSPQELRRVVHDGRSPAVVAEAARRLVDGSATDDLVRLLKSDDPFVREAGRYALGRSLDVQRQLGLFDSPDPKVRREAALVLREAGTSEGTSIIPRLLDSDDPEARFIGVQWAAESNLGQYREKIARSLGSAAETRGLFEAYLAALERLDGRIRLPKAESAGQEFVGALLLAPETTPEVRRRALRMLKADSPVLTEARLKGWIGADDPALRLEAIRTLREGSLPGRAAILGSIATDAGRPERERAEAVVGLDGNDGDAKEILIRIATEGPPALRREARRSLRAVPIGEGERMRIEGGEPAEAAAPSDLAGWLRVLANGEAGDPEAGERLFFSPKGPGCYRCHEFEGRGGDVGPELSSFGRTATKERLIESIAAPAREIAPQFVPMVVARTDGTIVQGLPAGLSAEGHKMFVDNKGERITIRDADIAEMRPMASASIMPDGLAAGLSVRDFRDLIAYLRGGKP